MSVTAPQIYVIAGPNGSGKTTSAKTLLPQLLKCHEYVNADSVAAALSPFNPDSVAMHAGRLMLERINYLANQSIDFAFETTLASRTFIPFLKQCINKGYVVNIIYLWLQSSKIAVERVKTRVEQGGHDIPYDVIIRRYHRSIHNFIKDYAHIANNWAFYDNSSTYSELIASKINKTQMHVLDHNIWAKVQNEVEYEIA